VFIAALLCLQQSVREELGSRVADAAVRTVPAGGSVSAVGGGAVLSPVSATVASGAAGVRVAADSRLSPARSVASESRPSGGSSGGVASSSSGAAAAVSKAHWTQGAAAPPTVVVPMAASPPHVLSPVNAAATPTVFGNEILPGVQKLYALVGDGASIALLLCLWCCCVCASAVSVLLLCLCCCRLHV
jgi:hypothetical protein